MDSFYLVLFILGLIGSVILIGLKIIEIKTGNAKLLVRVSSFFDKVVIFFKTLSVVAKIIFSWHTFMRVLVYLIHSFIVVSESLLGLFKKTVRKIPHSGKVIEAVKGKYELSKRREASMFLRKIEERR